MHLPPASFSSSTSSLSWTAPPPPPPMPVPVPYLASTYAAPSSLPPPLPAADRFMGSTAALPLYSGVLEASHGGMMAAPQHQSGPQVDAATFSAPPPGAFVLVPLISTAVPPALAGIFASSAAPAGMDAPPTSHHNIMTAPTVFPLPSASSHAITGWPLSGSRMPPPFGADPPLTQTPLPYHRITTDSAVVKKKPLVIPPPAPGDLEEGPRQLIVNYIAVDMNPDELRALFEAFGPVDVARTVPEPGTGHNKGFGFVYFRHSRDAAAAIDGLSGRVLRGKRLRVSYAVPQRPLAPQVPSFTAAPNAL